MKTTLLLLLMISSLAAFASVPMKSEFNDQGYYVIKSDGGDFQYKLDGRMMLDFAAITKSSDGISNSNINTVFRRLRLSFKNIFNKVWTSEFDINFSGEGDAAEIKDMWLGYTGVQNWTFVVGNHKVASSVDALTSSRNHVFMESSSMSEAFGVGRKVGFSAFNTSNYHFLQASVYGDEGDKERDDDYRPERYGYSARVVGRMANKDHDQVLSVGAHYATILSDPDGTSADELEFKADMPMKPYTGDGDKAKANLGDDFKSAQAMGIDVLAKYKKLAFQAEYMIVKPKLRNENSSTTEPEFKGYYAQVSYSIFGADRKYNMADAEFLNVYTEKNKSALEVALRYSVTDLTDSDWDTTGGAKINDITVGLNYFVNNNVSFKLNYVRSSVEDGDASVADKDVDVIGTRVQFTF